MLRKRMSTPVGYHGLVYTRYSLYLVRNSMNVHDYLCSIVGNFERGKAAVAVSQEC